MNNVHVQVSQYAVNAHPDPDSINHSIYTLTVEYRGRGLWAVCWKGDCIGRRGQRTWEPNPSSRTDRWLKAYRFDLDTALKIAKRAAPKLSINGKTAAECWAWEQARKAVSA